MYLPSSRHCKNKLRKAPPQSPCKLSRLSFTPTQDLCELPPYYRWYYIIPMWIYHIFCSGLSALAIVAQDCIRAKSTHFSLSLADSLVDRRYVHVEYVSECVCVCERIFWILCTCMTHTSLSFRMGHMHMGRKTMCAARTERHSHTAFGAVFLRLINVFGMRIFEFEFELSWGSAMRVAMAKAATTATKPSWIATFFSSSSFRCFFFGLLLLFFHHSDLKRSLLHRLLDEPIILIIEQTFWCVFFLARMIFVSMF